MLHIDHIFVKPVTWSLTIIQKILGHLKFKTDYIIFRVLSLVKISRDIFLLIKISNNSVEIIDSEFSF